MFNECLFSIFIIYTAKIIIFSFIDNFRFSLQFSLPTFQGGKHACNPILFEDQPLPDQRPTKLGCAKNDPLNDDYIAGYSPFVMRDINSRAARLGIKSHDSIKHWMKKNPNSARKKK